MTPLQNGVDGRLLAYTQNTKSINAQKGINGHGVSSACIDATIFKNFRPRIRIQTNLPPPSCWNKIQQKVLGTNNSLGGAKFASLPPSPPTYLFTGVRPTLWLVGSLGGSLGRAAQSWRHKISLQYFRRLKVLQIICKRTACPKFMSWDKASTGKKVASF